MRDKNPQPASSHVLHVPTPRCSPWGERICTHATRACSHVAPQPHKANHNHPPTVTATDSDGNKFELKKVPGSDSTETVRFKSMYVKGGAQRMRPAFQLPWQRLPWALDGLGARLQAWRECERELGAASQACAPRENTKVPKKHHAQHHPRPVCMIGVPRMHLPRVLLVVVKDGRLVGCQARSEKLNVYVVQVGGAAASSRPRRSTRPGPAFVSV